MHDVDRGGRRARTPGSDATAGHPLLPRHQTSSMISSNDSSTQRASAKPPLLPLWEKVAEGRMRGISTARAAGYAPLIRPCGAILFGTSFELERKRGIAPLLPLWEKVAEGRMRGKSAGFWSRPPHPPLRGTFSHKGRRGEVAGLPVVGILREKQASRSKAGKAI